MRIPSGCSRLEKEEIVDRVKGMIFGKQGILLEIWLISLIAIFS